LVLRRLKFSLWNPFHRHYQAKQNTDIITYLQVDWDVVAQKSGFSNGKTAATRFSQIKKKWGAMSSDVDTTASTAPVAKTPKTPKTKTPKYKTKVGSGTNSTPSKVSKGSPTPKKRGRKSKVVKEEEPEENGHDDPDMDESLAVAEEEVENFEVEENSIEVEN
jgi:hypothetical protein